MKRRGLFAKLKLVVRAIPEIFEASADEEEVYISLYTGPPTPIPHNSLGETKWQYDCKVLGKILEAHPEMTKNQIESQVIKLINRTDSRGLLICAEDETAMLAASYGVQYNWRPA